MTSKTEWDLSDLRRLAAEALSEHNDSSSREGYRVQFRETADREEEKAEANLRLIRALRKSVFGEAT